MHLAEVLATMPDVCAALLAAHRPDSTGHCRCCAGATGAAPVSPCRLQVLAEDARRLAPSTQDGRETARPFSSQAAVSRSS